MEFTARGDFAHEVFGKHIKYAIKELPSVILGVGSVNDAASASLYMALGANSLLHQYYVKILPLFVIEEKYFGPLVVIY